MCAPKISGTLGSWWRSITASDRAEVERRWQRGVTGTAWLSQLSHDRAASQDQQQVRRAR